MISKNFLPSADATGDTATSLGDVSTRVQEKVAEIGQKASEYGQKAMSAVRESRVRDVVSDVQAYVKAHPTQALIGAAVVGFLAGRMLRRN